MTRRRTYALLAVVCALPRLAILLHERDAVTSSFTEKSDTFALTFVQHGTFGFLSGIPSAYTQPLYGWALVPVYWIFGRSWMSIGLYQIVLAALTMTLGNLVAITQDNVKRMLAYSSIAHTGYILVGLAAYAGGQQSGISAVIFYGAAYTFMNMGAFAVITALQRRPGVTSQISTFAGLGRRDPWLGALMALFLLSLTGIPPLAGFWAKAYVIVAAVQAGGWLTALAVLAMLNAAAAAFYYLRVVVYMYMREPAEDAAPLSPGILFRVGLAVTGIATLVFGLFPAIVTAVSNAAGVLKG